MWPSIIVSVILLSVIFCLARDEGETKEFVIACFYQNYAQYRPDKAKFTPDYYSPNLCTHIFYAFATMTDNFTMSPLEYNDIGQPGKKGIYDRVNEWKRNQVDLKTILSFGGYKLSTNRKKLLKTMISNRQNRQNFIKSAIEYVQKHNFDGLDFEWQYPEAEDKTNFAILLTEMSSKFHEKGLLLTAAVSSSLLIIDNIYDVEVLNALDMVNIMTYDMHGPWDKEVGHNSPLYDNHGDQISVSSAAEYWVKQGLSKDKIIIGFPAFGHRWTLSNIYNTAVKAPAMPSKGAKYTNETGFLAYFEVCQMITEKGVKRYFDDDQKAPYFVSGDQWITYDNEKSVKLKAAWLKQSGYLGAYIWTLDMDDFNNFCKSGSRFPLLNAIKEELSY